MKVSAIPCNTFGLEIPRFPSKLFHLGNSHLTANYASYANALLLVLKTGIQHISTEAFVYGTQGWLNIRKIMMGSADGDRYPHIGAIIEPIHF